MSGIEKIVKLFKERGDSDYGGEEVNQREHALQCAALAEHAGASSTLITAALLHDIGHLVHALPADAPDQGIDDLHEELGNRFLKSMFPPAVSEPVRLHVDAKRYLCALDPPYLDQLSEPSLISLKLQGGPMSTEEVRAFESNPFGMDAMRLRRWDDMAKVQDLQTPEIEHFLPFLEASLDQHAPRLPSEQAG